MGPEGDKHIAKPRCTLSPKPLWTILVKCDAMRVFEVLKGKLENLVLLSLSLLSSSDLAVPCSRDSMKVDWPYFKER